LSHQHAEAQYTSSLLKSFDAFNFSTLSSPSKTNAESSTHIVTEDKNDSSVTSELPTISKDNVKFNVTKVVTSSTTWSPSGVGRTCASQPGGEICDTALSEADEQITVSPTTDTGINVEAHSSPQHEEYDKNISNVTSEEIILPPVTTDMPLTPTAQHSPANHVGFYSSPDTSPVPETTSYSSDTNANSFPVNTTMTVSQPKNGTNFPQNKGSKHFIHPKLLNKSTVPELNTGTENMMTSNVSHHPSVSETTINPLPTSSVSNNSLKRLSNEDLQISSPAYHPNDVIHVSSSELYASDGSHNISNEEKHPCARICKEGAPPMVCKYRFELEWYYTMSKACYDCPLHLEDCSRKDCIVSDGVRRPIVVVNRQMPGPSVEVSSSELE
jgi:hypothetical protein